MYDEHGVPSSTHQVYPQDKECSSHGDFLDSSRSSHLQLGKHVHANVTALVQLPDYSWKTSLHMLPRDETWFRFLRKAGIATRVPPRMTD